MRQGKSSQRANRIKKQQRMESKKDLKSYYIKVVREPLERWNKPYTKIVDHQTADRLIYGKIEIGLSGIPKRIKLSRNFKEVA
ncbi:MAG: hypothetical protein J7K80_02425 [Candidatus Izimaplasma sp.]|nr:hypothetical protein [Candidatus Izimaplasma bacterium]